MMARTIAESPVSFGNPDTKLFTEFAYLAAGDAYPAILTAANGTATEKQDAMLEIQTSETPVKIKSFKTRPALTNPTENAIVIQQSTSFDKTTCHYSCMSHEEIKTLPEKFTTVNVSFIANVLLTYPPSQVIQK